MSLLVPLFVASYVLLQAFDIDLIKPANTKKDEVSTSEIKVSEKTNEIKNEVVVEKPKEEVKIEEPKVEEKVEEPKVEEKVEEPKVEEKVEEPKVEEKVEEPKEQSNQVASSEAQTENNLQEENVNNDETGSSTNWLIIALYIFIGLFILATISYFFTNRSKAKQRAGSDVETTNQNQEYSNQNQDYTNQNNEIPSKEEAQNQNETNDS